MNEFEKDIIKVIFTLKKKPISYLGAKSITRLKCFLDGFCWGYGFPSFCSFFFNFQEIIETKYNIYNSSWDLIFLQHTNNEIQAFDLFFEEFQDFLQNNNINFDLCE